MEESKNEQKKVLLLIKIDAENLYRRVKYRKKQYIRLISMKRNREHIHKIFFSRFNEIKIDTLMHYNQELIYSLNAFYTKIEELYWYLCHSEDMPATVEDKIDFEIIGIEKLFDDLRINLDIELTGADANENELIPNVPSPFT